MFKSINQTSLYIATDHLPNYTGSCPTIQAAVDFIIISVMHENQLAESKLHYHHMAIASGNYFERHPRFQLPRSMLWDVGKSLSEGWMKQTWKLWKGLCEINSSLLYLYRCRLHFSHVNVPLKAQERCSLQTTVEIRFLALLSLLINQLVEIL